MRSLSASELLQVWEEGLHQHPIQRALRLLIAAFPATPPDVLATLSIGQRDACLLTLREQVFGSQLVSLTPCPHCGDRLELTLNIADLRVDMPPLEPLASTTETIAASIYSIAVDEYDVQFRLPNSLDLLAIAQAQPTDAPQLLLDRCLLAVRDGDKANSIKALPQAVRDAVVQQMADADPQAEMQLAMHCPSCDHQWFMLFDILSFFWSEINAWATRILREVHTLASAYSWREADILAMSPNRRQLYLDLVRGG